MSDLDLRPCGAPPGQTLFVKRWPPAGGLKERKRAGGGTESCFGARVLHGRSFYSWPARHSNEDCATMATIRGKFIGLVNAVEHCLVGFACFLLQGHEARQGPLMLQRYRSTTARNDVTAQRLLLQRERCTTSC